MANQAASEVSKKRPTKFGWKSDFMKSLPERGNLRAIARAAYAKKQASEEVAMQKPTAVKAVATKPATKSIAAEATKPEISRVTRKGLLKKEVVWSRYMLAVYHNVSIKVPAQDKPDLENPAPPKMIPKPARPELGIMDSYWGHVMNFGPEMVLRFFYGISETDLGSTITARVEVWAKQDQADGERHLYLDIYKTDPIILFPATAEHPQPILARKSEVKFTQAGNDGFLLPGDSSWRMIIALRPSTRKTDFNYYMDRLVELHKQA